MDIQFCFTSGELNQHKNVKKIQSIMTSIAATSCYWTRERHFLEKLIPCKKILLVNGNVHQECGEYHVRIS